MAIFVFAFLVLNQGGVIAGEPTCEVSLGEKLVRQLWADMKAGKHGSD